MIQHEVSIHLNRPVEQVFAYLINPDNLHNWQSNLIETELLTEKPLQVGTRFREVRRLGPRQAEIYGEITAYKPNRHFATKTLSKPQASVSYTFEPDNSGTRLSYKFVLLTSGITRLFEPLFGRLIKKQRESDFATLKRHLESDGIKH